MANGDVFEVIDVMTIGGKEVMNVYHYRRDSLVAVGGDAAALSADFIADVIPKIAAFQPSTLVHTAVKVRNIFNPSEALETPISVAGANTAMDILPRFNAIDFILSGDNPAVRNGRKRIAGVVETYQQNGVVMGSAYLPLLDTFANQLSTALQHGAINTFFPVIVKRVLTGGVYGLPALVADLVFSSVVDALYNVAVTSQTSRK